MKTQIDSVNDVKKNIHFEIPWEEVEKHVKEAVRQISRVARIPGFRPGKAPEGLIRARFAQQIKEEVVNRVVRPAFGEVVQENKLQVVSEPLIHDVVYAEGSPLLFQITVETYPHFEVKNYKGIPVSTRPVEVTEEEIDQVLKSYQESAAELVPLPDAVAAKGHFVVAHVKAAIEVEGKRKTVFDDRIPMEVGHSEKHPAFNEHLPGKKAGDVVEFDAFYAEDHPEKGVAGKTVHYEVKIESVNERRLTPIDDEFARDLGNFQSLADLREKIRQDLLSRKKDQLQNDQKNEIFKYLIATNPFEVPESLIRMDAETMLKEYAYNLHQRGVLNDPSINWKELQERFWRQAEEHVRASLILEKIAEMEKMEVTAEEVDKAIQSMAEAQRRAPEAIKAELIKEEKLDSLKRRILIQKTLDFLLEHANIRITEV